MVDLHKRRAIYLIISGAILVTLIGVSSFLAQAGTSRPFRYYTDDGATAFTYNTSSTAGNNISTWGINTDNPVCELQIGDLCLNGTRNITQGVFINGSAITGSGSGTDLNNYTTNINVNSSNGNCTLQVKRNGISANLTANFTCLSSAGGSGTVTSISQGFGISAVPNPITTTGTISWDNDTLTTICASGEYSRWNGTKFNCFTDTSGDGNNFPTSLTVLSNVITMGRSGLADLVAYIQNNSITLDYANITNKASFGSSNSTFNGNITGLNATAGYFCLFRNSTDCVSNYTPSMFYSSLNPSGYINGYILTNITSLNFTVSGSSTTLQINFTDGRSYNSTFTDQTSSGSSGGNSTISSAYATQDYGIAFTPNQTNIASDVHLNWNTSNNKLTLNGTLNFSNKSINNWPRWTYFWKNDINYTINANDSTTLSNITIHRPIGFTEAGGAPLNWSVPVNYLSVNKSYYIELWQNLSTPASAAGAQYNWNVTNSTGAQLAIIYSSTATAQSTQGNRQGVYPFFLSVNYVDTTTVCLTMAGTYTFGAALNAMNSQNPQRKCIPYTTTLYFVPYMNFSWAAGNNGTRYTTQLLTVEERNFVGNNA